MSVYPSRSTASSGFSLSSRMSAYRMLFAASSRVDWSKRNSTCRTLTTVRTFRVARKYPSNFSVPGQRHVHDKVVSRHPRDLEQFFVERVVFHGPFHRTRISHEFRAVQNLDRLLSRQAGRDQLPRSRVAEHQMRLDEPERDMEIGVYKPFIYVNWCAGGSRTQEPVLPEFACVMVDDPKIFGNRFAYNFAYFIFRSRAV